MSTRKERRLRTLHTTIIMSAIATIAIQVFSADYLSWAAIVAGIVIVGIEILIMREIRDLPFEMDAPLRVIDSTTEVTIKDVEGRIAIIDKTQVFIALQPDIKIITDHGLWAEGNITVLERSCGDLDVEVEPKLIESGRKRDMRFSFLQSPEVGKRYTRNMVYKFEDSFTGNQEYFLIRLTRGVERLRLVINVPKERPIKEAWLVYTDEGTAVELRNSDNLKLVVIDGVTSRAVYTASRPKLKSVHQIYWKW